ncbi:MAG: hypothetical protein EOP83_05170 [Verrucomicrobiaceae bacterium]|nr:MAG: hypothetical protein EOP83_05170 [Verrucomicrobiaceae bacterium]
MNHANLMFQRNDDGSYRCIKNRWGSPLEIEKTTLGQALLRLSPDIRVEGRDQHTVMLFDNTRAWMALYDLAYHLAVQNVRLSPRV